MIPKKSDNLRIFMAYRRRDTSAVAGRLYDLLVTEFGTNSVFFDIDQIAPGSDFRDVISDAIKASSYVLLLIGRDWRSEDLQNEEDYLRLELEAALQSDVTVIPILVDEAEMPAPAELPASIADLAYRQALRLSRRSFRTGVDQLMTFRQVCTSKTGPCSQILTL